MSEASSPITTPPSKSTCRQRIRTIWSGLPPESYAGRKKSARTRPHSVEKIIETRTHPEQAYRSCLGILRLEKHYSKAAPGERRSASA